MDRHYHIWLYERSEDGTINTLRRDPTTYEKRRKANYALERFRVYDAPGQVLACDNGTFCQPHLTRIRGYTLGGPMVIPVSQFIDNQTNSIRPSRKE